MLRAVRAPRARDALGVVAATVLFVRLYEEPTLERRFGAQYAAYRRRVPRWLGRPAA